MNLLEISQKITHLCNADTNEYVNALRLIDINSAQDVIETIILRSQDGWHFDDVNQTNEPVLTANLVSGTQTYSLPVIDAKIVEIKRVEITYDGTNWYKAEPFNIKEYSKTSDITTVKSLFVKTEPKYTIIGKNIYLYPIPDAAVTGGLKIIVGRMAIAFTASDLTTGTASPGFDRQFHSMIPIYCGIEWGLAKGLANLPALQNEWIKMEARVRDFYSNRLDEKKYRMTAKINNFK